MRYNTVMSVCGERRALAQVIEHPKETHVWDL